MDADDPVRPDFESGPRAGLVQDGIIGDDIDKYSPQIKRDRISLFGKNKVQPVISDDDIRRAVFANMKPDTM